MSLRDIAASDSKFILSDVHGNTTSAVITAPNGDSAELSGIVTDVAISVDPETGLQVTGRSISFSVSLQDLQDKGLGIPRNQMEKAGKPWRVEYSDIFGKHQVCKIMSVNPDRSLGRVDMLLEIYRYGATRGVSV